MLSYLFYFFKMFFYKKDIFILINKINHPLKKPKGF